MSKKKKKPKCEDIGFKHSWQPVIRGDNMLGSMINLNTGERIEVFANEQRCCENCGKVQEKITEWRDLYV